MRRAAWASVRTGTGPSLAAMPPSSSRERRAVLAPRSAARNAAMRPAGPEPMTMTSINRATIACLRGVLPRAWSPSSLGARASRTDGGVPLRAVACVAVRAGAAAVPAPREVEERGAHRRERGILARALAAAAQAGLARPSDGQVGDRTLEGVVRGGYARRRHGRVPVERDLVGIESEPRDLFRSREDVGGRGCAVTVVRDAIVVAVGVEHDVPSART